MNQEYHYKKQIKNRNSCICCLIGFTLVLITLLSLLFSALYYIATINYKNKNNETCNDLIQSEQLINDIRLLNTIKPIKYDLVLHPHLTNGSLSGRVSMVLNVTNVTDLIQIQGKYLIFDDVKLYHTKALIEFSKLVKVLEYVENVDNEMWSIKLNELLMPDVYELIIVYHSSPKRINSNVGFYESVYTDRETNETRSIATSKFEPTYARQAFPCFDEPQLKAKYSVKLVRPTAGNYIALSNMDQINEEQFSETETLVTFRESVPMSTYLSCFIVCDFDYTEKIINPPNGLGDPFPFRVYATPEQKNKTKFALETGSKIITFYIDYFQISYPLPKLDMVAIPDFSSGAMETWGLITFRETAVLYSSDTSSIKNKERVATVVAHELAHMWFGNLVTMNWWDELWLNEGFATYIEYLGVDHVYKDWQMENEFIIAELHRAFNADAKISSHPIVVSVTNPDEITAVFDAISYSKGASILRMLRNFVGHEQFRQGITDYLNKNKYGNAKSEDLYQAIQANVDKKLNVSSIMYTWTKQMGYPEIFVRKTGEASGTFEVTQNRFLLRTGDGFDKSDSQFEYRWSIPLTYITDTQTEPKLEFFYYNQPKFEIKVDPKTKWIKFNVGQNGYYRVNYSGELWKQLISNYPGFSIADRTSLLNDAFNLAAAKRLAYTVPLTLTQKLICENDTIPWKVAAKEFYKFKRLLFYTDAYINLQKYVLNLIQPILKNMKWDVEESEPHMLRQLRVLILHLACEFEDPQCLEEAGKRLKSYVEDRYNKPHQDIRSIVFIYGMWSIGTQKEWDVLWERYLQETDAQVKVNYRSGLAHVRNPTLIARYINLAWNPEYVRRQDYLSTIKSIADNPVATPLVWDYVRDNWESFVHKFGLNDRYLGRMIPEITDTFTSPRKLTEMKEFFAKYPNAGAGASARRQAIENVETNIKWLENNLEDINKWLNKTIINQIPY